MAQHDQYATCAATPGWRCRSRPSTIASPVVIGGHVAEWLTGEAAWQIIDELATT